MSEQDLGNPQYILDSDNISLVNKIVCPNTSEVMNIIRDMGQCCCLGQAGEVSHAQPEYIDGLVDCVPITHKPHQLGQLGHRAAFHPASGDP